MAIAWMAVAVVAGGIASLGGGEKPLTPAQKRAKRAQVGGPFPLELRSPQVVGGTAVRVLVGLRRPSLGQLVATRRQTPAAQRAYVRSLTHEARALMSALTAKGVHFGDPVLFSRVWSGFAATIATKDLPAVQTLGLRVEPVERFYPAQVPANGAPAVRPLPTTASNAGPVAILDAFPRSAHPVDAVGRVGNGRPSPAEGAGLRLAGVVTAELPRARVIAIRAAGSQALDDGSFQVFGTTDQLLAALEHVVDPDRNGDTNDAVRVALTGLSAPYAGFSDSPPAAAVDAAGALGTLVVAPAGEGGRPEGIFGSIGAPGAATGALAVGALDGSGRVAPASSRGPTYELGAKPDLAIGGGAQTAAGAAWGTAIAAARVAGVAAALRAERPRLTPREAGAALIGTAAPRGPLLDAGGGDPLLQAARVTPLVAEPAAVVLSSGGSSTVRIRNLGRTARDVQIGAGAGVQVSPSRLTIDPGRTGTITISAPPGARGAGGRIVANPIGIPYTIVTAQPPPPPLGDLAVIRRLGKPDGVRFTAGSFKRGPKGAGVVPVGNLVLTLEGPASRELTPPGGATDLLPGEYAYTLTGEILRTLPAGRYRFTAQGRGTVGGRAVVRASPFFRIR